MMKQWRILYSSILAGLAILLTALPALAHEAPDEGAEWLMADWMLLSFLVFFGVALTVFLVAVKRGLLRNIEEAKYYLLTIDEPDYYTPDWAKEGAHATER